MKRFFIFFTFVLVLALFAAGCQKASGTEDIAAPSQADSSAEKQETPPEDASAQLIDPGIAADGKMDAYLESFETLLADSGLTLEDKTVKDAASIGAAEGYGFQINYAPFELYLFDPDSGDEKTAENLKTAEESGYITIFGVELNGEVPKPECAFHQNMVLIFLGEDYGITHPNKDAITSAFLNISE